MQSNNEKLLVAADKCIRGKALKRKKVETEDGEEGDSSARSSAKKARARRLEVAHSDDEGTAAILRHGELRRKSKRIDWSYCATRRQRKRRRRRDTRRGLK